MNIQLLNPQAKSIPYISSFLLLVAHAIFFYLYEIDSKGVLFAVFYFIFVLAIPGFLFFSLFFRIFSSQKEDNIDKHLVISLSAVLGIANILFSYLLAQVGDNLFIHYVFIWPFFILLFKAGRLAVRSVFPGKSQYGNVNYWFLPILLLFALLFNVYFFAMRPTPGILPVEVFHDHLWNAGNTVALMNHFPLQSLRIESMPYLSYHILVHILGAHMAILTGLTPHLVGLQYVFIPLIPLFVYSMIGVLRQFFKNDNKYLIYGLAVLIFGGGFHVVHEVKVLNLLGSTNFLGVIMLFLFLTTVIHLNIFTNTGRFLLMFIGLFLATVAKGTIGIALCGGVGLWWLFRLYKRDFASENFADVLGASIGFLSSYFLFFTWPVLGQQFRNVVFEEGTFPLAPLDYVTKNELTAESFQLIQSYLPEAFQLISHITILLLALPIYLLLYFSYRLLVIYYIFHAEFEDGSKKVVVFVISSLLIAYTINLPYPQDYAYFLTTGVILMDALFILFLQKEDIFNRLKVSLEKKSLFASIGILFVLVLPFIDMSNRIRSEHTHNYFFSGVIGRVLDDRLKNSSYRKTMQAITPEMYSALSYIRKYSDGSTIVISPFVHTPDGRPRAFYTSTFAERTAFVEGYYEGSGGAKYSNPEEINEKLAIIDSIYKMKRIPEQLRNKKYVYIVAAEQSDEFLAKYPMQKIYTNSIWGVLQF